MKKFIMKVKIKLAEFALKKWAGGWIVEAYKKLEGNKTQVGTVGIAIASGLLVFGVIDQGQYEKALAALGSWVGISLAQKGERYQEVFKTAKELKVGAEEVLATGKKLKADVEEELKKKQ